LLLALTVSCGESRTAREEPAPPRVVTAEDKAAFLAWLDAQPATSEFFSDEVVVAAESRMPVLFAFTSADRDFDLYPLAALSRGLVEHPSARDYATQHFADIADPALKLFWAVILFDQQVRAPQVVDYLKSALASSERSSELAEMCGPEFEDLRRRVTAQ
jgi:hypothetical protein